MTVAVAFSDVALYSEDLAGAEALARAFIPAAQSDEMRALCHILLAHIALARRNQRSAWTELAAAEQFDRASGLETRALFSALPFVILTGLELLALRDELLAWDAAGVAPSGFMVFAMHNGLHEHLRPLSAGADRGAPGRREGGARARRGTRGAAGAGGGSGARGASHPRGAGAGPWSAGNPAAALTELESGRSEAWFQLTVASPFYSQAFERFMRAELLEELGRKRRRRAGGDGGAVAV